MLLNAKLIPLTTVLVFSMVSVAPGQDWTIENQTSFELTRHGEGLPPAGIYTDIYYTGELGVFVGDHENEFAVKIRLVQVTPRLDRFRQPESPQSGTLRCEFYEKPPVGMTSDERATISIPTNDQGRIEVENGDLIRIQVPDHASWIALSLQVEKFRKEDVAIFLVSRPYREEAMRRINEQRSHEAERRALQEGKQIIDVDREKCKGTGQILVPETERDCDNCKGTGWWPPDKKYGRRWRCPDTPSLFSRSEERCDGYGGRKVKVPAHNERC